MYQDKHGIKTNKEMQINFLKERNQPVRRCYSYLHHLDVKYANTDNNILTSVTYNATLTSVMQNINGYELHKVKNCVYNMRIVLYLYLSENL